MPLPLRELIVNLSQYLYQNLHEVGQDKKGCNKRFLRTFKVLVESDEFRERLKLSGENNSRVTLGESYLQIIKLLFEG